MSLAEGTEAAGLYLHVPFCSAICPYCDFAVRRDDAARREAYVGAVEREAELAAERWRHLTTGVPGAERFDTLYLGGGTPSLLEPRQLERVLAALRRALPLAPGAHLSLEANPEDVDAEHLATWRGLGVDFLSLGVQALDDDALAFFGRRHTARQAEEAITLALEAGFPTVNVDLIYALPGVESGARTRFWHHTLDRAAALGPQHLSCYGLEIHPRTSFGKRQARGELHPLDDDRHGELFLATHRRLAELGYEGYEVSNFARSPEHRSRHNRKYWHHVPYLGIGPSAHSFAGRRRWWNEPLVPRWQKRVAAGEAPVAGEETLEPADLALEALMLGLRTRDGVDLDALERRYGIDLGARNHRRLAELEARGLLRIVGRRLIPTLEGLAVADGLAAGLDVVP